MHVPYFDCVLQGRNILQIPKGVARSAAMRHAARYFRLNLESPSNRLRAEVNFEQNILQGGHIQVCRSIG